MKNEVRPIHPGNMLQEEYLGPLGMTVDALAEAMRVLAPDIEALINDESDITPDMAERLAEHFGGDKESWLAMQAEYDRKTRVPAPPTEADIKPSTPERDAGPAP